MNVNALVKNVIYTHVPIREYKQAYVHVGGFFHTRKQIKFQINVALFNKY